jgi:plastocyanin
VIRAALLGGLAAVLALAPSAGAAGMPGMDAGGGDGPAPKGISIGFAAFATPRIDIIAGDAVRWSNDSARSHDVVAADGSFDSGRVFQGEAFAHRFTAAGTVSYFCSLHPFMTGEIDVHDVLLDTPGQRAGSGKPYVLTGRVAAGSAGTVAIQADGGSGFASVATAAVGADGTFRTIVVPRTTSSYRALTGGETSPAVQLLVLDHQVVVGAQRRRGGLTALSVQVTPAAPGQTIVLQERLRERFGWWPVATVKLDARSRARFLVPRRDAVPARVLLTLPDGATELARSRTVHVGVAPPHHQPAQATGMALTVAPTG